MIWTDTHAHIYVDKFKEDEDAMMKRAFEARVERIFMPNIDLQSIDDVIRIAKKYPDNCFPMMGLHPCSVDKSVESDLESIFKWFDQLSFVAVGEIGIDLYWDKTHIEEQKWAFREQIRFAKERRLPIVIHARDSFDEIFEIVDEENDEYLTGIFHCFTGTLEQAQKIIDYGDFWLGIGGVATFKNGGMDKVLPKIDPWNIVLETDSPYLAPEPKRGKRNEPSYIPYIANQVSQLMRVSMDELAEITTENSRKIFRR